MSYSACPCYVSTLNTIGTLGDGAQVERTHWAGGLAITTWPTAKLVLYFPISISQSFTVKKTAWLNGTTINGNVEVGVYNEVGTRLGTTGTVAQSGSAVWQASDNTDYTLPGPGRFYIAFSSDSATAQFQVNVNLAGLQASLGVMEEVTGSFGLPATWTPIVTARAYAPLALISGLTVV